MCQGSKKRIDAMSQSPNVATSERTMLRKIEFLKMSATSNLPSELLATLMMPFTEMKMPANCARAAKWNQLPFACHCMNPHAPSCRS